MKNVLILDSTGRSVAPIVASSHWHSNVHYTHVVTDREASGKTSETARLGITHGFNNRTALQHAAMMLEREGSTFDCIIIHDDANQNETPRARDQRLSRWQQLLHASYRATTMRTKTVVITQKKIDPEHDLPHAPNEVIAARTIHEALRHAIL